MASRYITTIAKYHDQLLRPKSTENPQFEPNQHVRALAQVMRQELAEGHMLRITESLENGKTVRLRLDGTVNAQSLPELEEICSHHRGNDGRVVILLDLAGVVFMTDEVAKNWWSYEAIDSKSSIARPSSIRA